MKKSIFLFFAAILCASSTWAANVGFESSGNTMKYYSNLKSSDQTVNLDRTNGTTTNLGAVTALYLKGFACKMYQDADNTIWGGGAQHAYYKIHRTAVAAGTSGYTDVTDWDWNWQNWSSGWRYPTGSKSLDVNLLSGLGSGKYSMTYYFQQKGSSTWRLPSTSSKYNVLTWTINVPDITSAECTSNGTGLGTEASPFMVPVGDILTLTVKGTQESDDANSELYAQFASNAYSSTLTHNITPTTTVQSITIKVKYYNSADQLSSNEKTLTIYYKAIQEETNNVTISCQCNGNKIENIDDEMVKVGVSTPSEITAPVIVGYTFSSWTLGAGVQSADATANPISITTKSGETDYTLVANYTEDLTTSWGLIGSFVDDFKTAYDFVKKSGESTSKVAYVSIDLKSHKEYQFKVVEGKTWYGNNNSDEQWWIKQTSENWDFYDDAVNCHMKTGLAGTYTFKIDYSGANPKVSVYFPEIYAIVGSFNEWNENANKLTFNGNIGTATINLEASTTNYEFKVIDNAVHGGIVNKTITQTENDLAITVGGGDNIKLTANANPKGNYIFTYDKSTKKLSVTYPTVYTITVEAENGTVEGAGTYVEGTSVELTAKANEGYKFVNWTKGSEIVSTDASYTFTATEDAEFVANFEKETYTRTVTPGNYGTICLPYASSNYTGMELYEVSWLKEGTGLYLDQLAVGAQLVAGKPYIFKATDSEITVTYTGEAVAAPVAGAKGLTGTFTDIATGDAALVGNYIIAQNQIWIAGADNSLPANRAYINALLVPKTEQAKLPGRRRVCMGENAATGLDNITNGENTTIKVIENGQLFIIRNGEKFNAQGQKL